MRDNKVKDLQEQLFQAINNITSKKLTELEYDVTLKCEIVDNSEATKGIYTVTDDSSTFIAYSDCQTYKKGQRVYVTVPKGDMSNNKIITGKIMSSESDEEYYTYISPIQNFIDVTGNLYTLEKQEFGRTANSGQTGINIPYIIYEGKPLQGFTVLALGAEFRTWLSEITSGTYGLKLIIEGVTKTTLENPGMVKRLELYLTNKDMYGNPYGFQNYVKQEKAFDISSLDQITKIYLYFVQGDDFIDFTGKKIEGLYREGEYQRVLPENLFARNIYLALGLSLSDYNQDTVLIDTLDPKTYKLNLITSDSNDKEVYLKWIRMVEGQARSIDEPSELPEGAKIHWYRYTLEDDVEDILAGRFWKEVNLDADVNNLNVRLKDIKEKIIEANNTIIGEKEKQELAIAEAIKNKPVEGSAAYQQALNNLNQEYNAKIEAVNEEFRQKESELNYVTPEDEIKRINEVGSKYGNESNKYLLVKDANSGLYSFNIAGQDDVYIEPGVTRTDKLLAINADASSNINSINDIYESSKASVEQDKQDKMAQAQAQRDELIDNLTPPSGVEYGLTPQETLSELYNNYYTSAASIMPASATEDLPAAFKESSSYLNEIGYAYPSISIEPEYAKIPLLEKELFDNSLDLYTLTNGQYELATSWNEELYIKYISIDEKIQKLENIYSLIFNYHNGILSGQLTTNIDNLSKREYYNLIKSILNKNSVGDIYGNPTEEDRQKIIDYDYSSLDINEELNNKLASKLAKETELALMNEAINNNYEITNETLKEAINNEPSESLVGIPEYDEALSEYDLALYMDEKAREEIETEKTSYETTITVNSVDYKNKFYVLSNEEIIELIKNPLINYGTLSDGRVVDLNDFPTLAGDYVIMDTETGELYVNTDVYNAWVESGSIVPIGGYRITYEDKNYIISSGERSLLFNYKLPNYVRYNNFDYRVDDRFNTSLFDTSYIINATRYYLKSSYYKEITATYFELEAEYNKTGGVKENLAAATDNLNQVENLYNWVNKFNSYYSKLTSEIEILEKEIEALTNDREAAIELIEKRVLEIYTSSKVDYDYYYSSYNTSIEYYREQYNYNFNSLSYDRNYNSLYTQEIKRLWDYYISLKNPYLTEYNDILYDYNAAIGEIETQYNNDIVPYLEQKNQDTAKVLRAYEIRIEEELIVPIKKLRANELNFIVVADVEVARKIALEQLEDERDIKINQLNIEKASKLESLGVEDSIKEIEQQYSGAIKKQEDKIKELIVEREKLYREIRLSAGGKMTYTFSPNVMLQQENIKTIIEYPSYEYAERLFSENEQIKELLKKYEGNEQFDLEYHSLVDYPLTETEINEDSEYKEDLAQIKEIIAQTYGSIKYYNSDILVFENESNVQGSANIQLIQNINIECDIDGYKGVYAIYDSNDEIMNRAEATKRRILSANYNSVFTGVQSLDQAETITWYIPIENSMISPPEDGVDYFSGSTQDPYFISYNEKDGYAIIKRSVIRGDNVIPGQGDELFTTAQQCFRIKDRYNQHYSNNVVKCRVVRNGIGYEAEFEMIFRPSGANGTNFSFYLEPVDKQAALECKVGATLELRPRLFSYENIEKTDEKISSISYSWYSTGDAAWEAIDKVGNGYQKKDGTPFVLSDNQDTRVRFRSPLDDYGSYRNVNSYIKNVTTEELSDSFEVLINQTAIDITKLDSGNVLLTVKDITNLNMETLAHYILCAKVNGVEVSNRMLTLDSYYTVPIRKNNTYSQYSGPDKIAYNSNGGSPEYNKEELTLWRTDRQKVDNVRWSMLFGQDTKSSSGIVATGYYPKIVDNRVEAPLMYFVDNGIQVSVAAKVNNEIVWIQPIRIYMYRYGSDLLNSWNGDLTIDEENGIILSSMVGAGIKDRENTFNGVLMGDVAKKADSATGEIGLYGFNKGEQSFGLKINGTAFFGKAGRGRIEFDGNKGTIKSHNYNGSTEGMLIDLDDSILNAYGPSGKVNINTSNSNDNLFNVKGKKQTDTNYKELINVGVNNFVIKSYDYKTGKEGMLIDLGNNSIGMYNNNGADFIELKGNVGERDSLFKIKHNQTVLVNIGNNNYFIQSQNEKTKFDLVNNKITLASSKNRVELNSDDNGSLFNISTLYGNAYKDLIKISQNDYFLQTANYTPTTFNSNSTVKAAGVGTRINLVSGEIISSSLNLIGVKGSNYVSINSTDGSYPIKVISSNKYITLGWDGKLRANDAEITGKVTASSGIIGGWTIKSGQLRASAGGKITALQAPSDNITYVIAAGGTNSNSYADYPFRVDKNGNMWATSANIEGTIKASSGTIGGWTINSDSLSGSGKISGGTISGSTISGSNISGGKLAGTTISGGSINIGNGIFKVGSDGNITFNGNMNAEGSTNGFITVKNVNTYMLYAKVLYASNLNGWSKDAGTHVYGNTRIGPSTIETSSWISCGKLYIGYTELTESNLKKLLKLI